MIRSRWVADRASGWAAALVALVLAAGLGSRQALEATRDSDDGLTPLLTSLTRFPAWNADAMGADADLNLAIAARLAVLVLGAFVLGVVAGRAGSAGAALLAGWGAFVLTCGLAGAVFYLVADARVHRWQLADESGGALSPLVREVNAGGAFALYTGVLVGAAVAIARRRAPVLVTAAGPAPDPAADETSIRQPVPVATWPPKPTSKRSPRGPATAPLAGTTAPSPAWTPPQTPLPAVPLPRRGMPRPNA